MTNLKKCISYCEGKKRSSVWQICGFAFTVPSILLRSKRECKHIKAWVLGYKINYFSKCSKKYSAIETDAK